MTSNRRFFSEEPIPESGAHALAGTEHQHLAKVLRVRAGDKITLFDGSGFEFAATVKAIQRNVTEVVIEAKQAVDRELPFMLTLAVALPKGDRQQWLVEKAVELGVTQLLPLKTEFGVAQPGEKAQQRISRWIVGASKQCGRNQLMRVGNAITPEQVFATKQTTVLVAHPVNSVEINDLLAQCADLTAGGVTLVIGPEGGFSHTEIGLARTNDCQFVSLGPRILRIETAAVALVCTLIYACRS